MLSSGNATVSFVQPSFGAFDYVVFAFFLCLSGAIGIFFSCRNQKTTGEYFFGDRQMSAVPVGISTGMSFLSAVTIVGFPTEMYFNGYGYAITAIFGSLFSFIAFCCFANVIHPLKVNSLSEYYEKRFNSKTLNWIASLTVLVSIFHYMGMCMYGSVVAFNSITGSEVSITLALVIGCCVGIFYTSIGGLKAVVWTDVLQCGIVFVAIIVVTLIAIINTQGGMSTIIEMNSVYDRFKTPPLSFDLTIRHSMWSLTLGGGITWAVFANQPAIIQRFASLPRKRDCYIVAALTSSIHFFFSLIPAWAGISIFGYYANKGCDVYKAGWIKKNGILLYFIRDCLNFPGFQGLFVAALYAGSLSSLSSGLNSASSLIWKDFIHPWLRKEPSEMRATLISKVIVVVFGILSMIWCYTLISFGGLIIQVCASMNSSVYGAYFSLFVYAIIFRHVNHKGAIAGVIVSFAFTLWLSIGSLLHGEPHISNLPTTTANCFRNDTNNNDTVAKSQVSDANLSIVNENRSGLKTLYSVSYLWLSVISMLLFMIVLLLITACTKSNQRMDPHLLLPMFRPGYFSKCRRCGKDSDETHNVSREEADDEQEE